MDMTALDSLRIVLDPVGQAGVAISLMLVMFSVALGLRVEDFGFLRQRERATISPPGNQLRTQGAMPASS